MAHVTNALADSLGDPVLAEVLRDIAAIAGDGESAGSGDGVEIIVIENSSTSSTSGSGSTGTAAVVVEGEIVVVVPAPDSVPSDDNPGPTTVRLPSAVTAPVVGSAKSIRTEPFVGSIVAADPYDEWQSEFADGDIAPWRHRPRNSSSVLNQPAVSVIPAAAACVLFLLVVAWSQLRRTRRRVVDSDWLLDVDLMESSYRDNHGAGGAVRTSFS